MKIDPKVEFYRAGVYVVLKKYEFSEEELKIIQAAIITAKKQNPNMRLIEKADALLKMVAASREAAPLEIDDLEIKKSISSAKLAGYKKIETSFWKKPLDKSVMRLYAVLTWAVLAISVNYYLGDTATITKTRTLSNGAEGHLELHSFEEAKKLCQKAGKVLPLTIDDAIEFLGNPDSINTQGFWSAEQKVIYNIAQGYDDNDGQKHYVVCVDTNGKGITQY